MKRIAVALVVLLFTVAAQAQTPAPKPAPELKTMEIWIGDWTVEGQAKDSPSEPEYKLTQTFQCRWTLGGSFAEARHAWKSQRGETTALEILGYDPIKKHYLSWGFGSGSDTWAATATFKNGTYVISGTTVSAEGKPITKWRNTVTFSPDRTSISVRFEREEGGTWWTSFTGKGVKAAPKGQ